MRRSSKSAEETLHIPSLDFSIWRAELRAGVMKNAHTHPDVEINFLRRGTLRYFMAGRFIDLRPGDLAIFWAGLPHQTLERSDDVEGIWLTLPLIWLLRWKHTREAAARLLKGDVLCQPAGPQDARLFEQWCHDFATADIRLRDIITGEIESRLSRLSLSLEGTRRPLRQTGGDQRLESVLRYLSAHYHEQITVDDVARAVGLHPKYLLTLFRRLCQMTLWEYVLHLRLAHAQRLLLTTDRTITDIAFEAGFQSLSAFYHAFRKHAPAASPAAFRSGGH